jgi:ribosomal protein S12 methylthiotransferase
VGKTLKVIVDREDEDFYIGRTEFDSPEVDGEVMIDKKKKLTIGSFCDVKIEAAHPFDLFATPVA